MFNPVVDERLSTVRPSTTAVRYWFPSRGSK